MKMEHKIISVSIIFCLLFWIIDALINYFFFVEGTFWNILFFDLSSYELYMRTTAFIFFLLFGIILSGIMTRYTRAKEKIQQQNNFLETILDAIPYPFNVIDATNYTIRLSNKFSNSDGVSENLTCYMVNHKSGKPCASEDHQCPLEEVKKTKKPVIMEHIHYDSDGSARHVEVHGYPIIDNAGNVIQMIEYCVDITDRKLMEKERIKASKLEGIHNLVVAVNHEMNQHLAVIISGTGLLKKSLENDAQQFDATKLINEAAWKLAELVKNMNKLQEKELKIIEYMHGVKMIDLNQLE